MADDAPEQTRTGPQLTHTQAVNRQRDLEKEISRLAELDEPTDEEKARFTQAVKEFDETNKWREHLERQAARAQVQSVVEGPLRDASTRFGKPSLPGKVERGSASGDGYDRDAIMEPDSVELRRFKDPWNLREMRTFDRSEEQLAREFRARAVSAISMMQGANDKIREAGVSIIERYDDEAGNLSRLALALSDPAYMRAWSKLARDPQSADLDEAERRAIAHVKSLARAMSLSDSAGGYLVPFQLDPTVLLTSDGSMNEIRQVARQVVATGDVWHGVSAGAVSWGYRAEAAEAGDDSPTFAGPEVPIWTADGFVPISVEALADAANVTAEVGGLLLQGKDDLEAVTFATGDGSGKPTGIVTALVASSPSVVVASAATDTFAIGDVHAVHDALPARYRGRPNAAWLGNNKIYSKIRQFDTAGGAGMWARLGEGRPEGLINRRVLEAEGMDGVINASAENYVLIFGDFSNYVIADRIGTTVEFIPHLFGGSGRPTGQRGWWAYVRHGADSVNDGGFRLLNVT